MKSLFCNMISTSLSKRIQTLKNSYFPFVKHEEVWLRVFMILIHSITYEPIIQIIINHKDHKNLLAMKTGLT